jgi:glycosyltransferase involved in cell wall biosynthesis
VSDSAAPLVSIVVPVFNGARYLRESLDSILAQCYPHTEVLVMDDASGDSTPAIIASYGDRVRGHRQPTNQGIYENMNAGIKLAKGEYIAFYHADDMYDSRIVEREVDYLRRFPDVGAVFCKDIFIDPVGREWGRLALPVEVRGGRPLPYDVVLNALLTYKNIFLRCPTSMVRAAVYRHLGGYRQDTFRNTADLEMWLRIAQQYPIGILDEYLLRYRQGHGSSAQRYHHLRTDPSRYFVIMDLYLSNGARALARPEALAAYEAHRAEDDLLRAVSLYIKGQGHEARAVLRGVHPRRIVASPRVQRARLLILLLAMQLLVRVPRVPVVADVFYRRWHVKRLNQN